MKSSGDSSKPISTYDRTTNGLPSSGLKVNIGAKKELDFGVQGLFATETYPTSPTTSFSIQFAVTPTPTDTFSINSTVTNGTTNSDVTSFSTDFLGLPFYMALLMAPLMYQSTHLNANRHNVMEVCYAIFSHTRFVVAIPHNFDTCYPHKE